jgi:hypothetical protein
MDADIRGGKPWESELRARLESAQAALVLVTKVLLKSRYVRDVEMPDFMKKIILVLIVSGHFSKSANGDLCRASKRDRNVKTPVNQSPTEADQ